MIKTDVKKLSNYRRELNIVVDKEDIEPIRKKETEHIRKEVQLPGFRKGKAPLGMVQRSYGQHIEAYTMESAVQEALKAAAREHNLPIIGTPEPKKIDFNDQGGLDITVEVDTYPDIEVKNYKGFEFIKDKYEIEDSFVEEHITRLLKQQAERNPVESKVKDGHIVTFDMQELDPSGVPVVGKKYNDIAVTIGEGRFDPELEKQLIGMEKEKEKKIVKEYPKDFPQAEMAGKKEQYMINIKKVEEEILPELNDEFVKKVNPQLNTVQELKELMRKNLEAEYKNEAENRFNQEVSQKLVEENSFEIPPVLVENYLDNIINDLKKRNPKVNEAEARQMYSADAEFNIKWYNLKSKIGEEENVTVDEKEVNEFLEKIENEEVRKFYEKNQQALDEIKHNLRDKKIFDFIVSHSKVKENEIKLD